VAVVAEWYPSPGDPVHGVWAHRQALAARDAGAELRVLALRRPVPPLSVLRATVATPVTGTPLREWAHQARGGLASLQLDGLSVEPVPFVAPPRPWSYGSWGRWIAPTLGLALARLRRRWPFDVVHAHNVVPTGDAAVLWRRSAGGDGPPAVVVSAHGPDIIHVAQHGLVGPRAARATLCAADLVLANSTWAAVRCARLTGGEADTRVVHLGADVPAGPPPRRARPTIVTVAHLQARKRHATVLHALAALRDDERPDYLVIGDGPGREPLARLAGRLGVADRVQFAGQLEHRRALEEAWRCHLFVMPSAEEPFGVAYVEAMAGGLPAIGASGEGGPEDIAAAGEGLVLVPPADHAALAAAIRSCLQDPGRLQALGAAARRTVQEHFTWERCGKATVLAYREAIERCGAPAGR